jgi:hypothetical protein
MTTPGFVPGTPTSANPADIALSQQVRAQLLNGSPGVPGSGVNGVNGIPPQALSNVQINANNGVVRLQGSVTTPAQREVLINRIRRMPGVQSVVDGLTVNPNPGNSATAPAGTAIPQP